MGLNPGVLRHFLLFALFLQVAPGGAQEIICGAGFKLELLNAELFLPLECSFVSWQRRFKGNPKLGTLHL